MKSKKLLALIGTIVLGLAIHAEAGTVKQIGKGAGSSCGAWTAERKSATEWLMAGSWVLGFMSGASSALDSDLLNGLDSDAILGWMDNYCLAHPLDRIAVGATRLLEARANRK